MQLDLVLRAAWKVYRLSRSSRWSTEQLRRYQETHLAELRRFAVEMSPFYRRFHKGLENQPLKALPILTKSTLMENFDDLVTDRKVRLADVQQFVEHDPGFTLFRGRYIVLLTSGTTAEPGVFLFNPEEWITINANFLRPMGLGRPRDPQGKPWRMASIAARKSWHLSARSQAFLTSRRSLHLDAAEPVEVLTEALNRWQPQLLITYPSVLAVLAAEQLAGRLRLGLKRIHSSGEVLTKAVRRRIQEAWGVPVREVYALTECGPIALDCAQGGTHLLEDRAIVEIVDEDGRAVPPGVCGHRMLLSVFGSRTQPLIRYEVSDRVELKAGSCECGRQFRLIEQIEGRTWEFLDFAHRDPGQSPVRAHSVMFDQVLERLPVAAWQVVQEQDALWISVIGVRDRRALDEAERALRDRLEQRGAVVPPIHFREVATLERGATGKVPETISRLRR